MREAPWNLRQILEPAVAAVGCELVGIEYHPSGRRSLLRVYIDRPEGVTVKDCEAVSHQVSGVLDVEDPIPGQYTLEVSSPGLDRPLFRLADFERFAGQRVRLKLEQDLGGPRNFRGTLQGVREGQVVLETDDGQELVVSVDEIEQARLAPGGTGPGRGQ